MQDHALWAEITKSEKQDDGSLLVEGTVSDETLDLDQQIADNGWLKDALPEWFRWGNIREQHSHIAAGVATEYEDTGAEHRIKALVVDPGSVAKVEAGVLKGFSIGIKGGRVVTDKAAPGGRIISGKIVEVSLVDRPSNPSCTLTLAKAATAGMTVLADELDAERGLVKVEELVVKGVAIVPASGDPLPMEAVITEQPTPEPVAGDEVCDCCAECPGDSCDGACCAACQYSKQPTASGSHQASHTGATATNGPNSSIKAANGSLLKMPAGMTSNDLREALSSAVKDTSLGRAADWTYVCDFTDTQVIACINDVYLEYGYTCDADGAVTLSDDPTEVVQHSTWQPKAATTDEDEPVTPETIAAAVKAGTITEEAVTAALAAVKAPAPDEAPTDPPADDPDAVKAPEADDSKAVTADTVKSAIAESMTEALKPLIERLETVEKSAAPGGPARTRQKADEITAHRGDELRNKAANYRALSKTIDNPDLSKAYIDLAVGAETELAKLAG